MSNKPIHENLYKKIVDKIAEGVNLVRADNLLIVYTNKKFNEIFGYDDGELIGEHVSILNYGNERQRPKKISDEIKKTLEQKGELTLEIKNVKKDGTPFVCRAHISAFDHLEYGKVWISIHEDISENKRAEETLRESEERYRSLIDDVIDSSDVGLFILDSNFKVVWVNQALERYLGLKRAEVVGEDKRYLIQEQIKHKFDNPEAFAEKVMATYENNTYVENFECRILTEGDRKERWLNHWSQPIRSGLYTGGRVELYYDISKLKQAEKALTNVKEEWESTFNTVPDLIAILDDKHQIVRVNKAMADKLGVTPDGAAGLTCYEHIHGTKEPPQFCPHTKLLADGLEHQIEVHEKRLGGDFFVTVSPLHDDKGHLVGCVHVARDITERKRSEEQIKASLKEKEILLREIHHRVKNNLAIISSLLSMQANIVTDQHVYSALQESQSRVRAMALIHETLYQFESLALVDLESYVKDLIENIVIAIDDRTGRIHFEIEVRDVKLEVNQAVPCGLIINELSTNALKHAFTDGKNGIVRIKAGYTVDNEVELTISDNGIGFPEELDWQKSKSLGLRLISLMVDQLHGNLDIRGNHGTEISIRWPLQTI